MAAKKIALNRLLTAIDKKDYGFYDRLDDDEKKAFSAYLAMRYEATVTGNSDLQQWFIMATNELVNLHLFDLNKHPKLQWLAIVSASPKMGKQYHKWIATKKKGGSVKASDKKIRAFLAKHNPAMKDDELDLLVALNDKKSVKQLAKEMGLDDQQIRSQI